MLLHLYYVVLKKYNKRKITKRIKGVKNKYLLGYRRKNAFCIDFCTGFKTMLPLSSIAVAVYARIVLPNIKKHADTVTVLFVVVLGF